MKVSSRILSILFVFSILSTSAIADSEQFASAIYNMTTDIWSQVFKDANQVYKEPALVFYSGSVPSACGRGSRLMGPFYCPADETVYLDVSFFEELEKKFEAPGDAAQAYVIAHEVAHHVQKKAGILDKIRVQQAMNPSAQNQLQTRVELHADCLAGVWTRLQNNKRKILEPGDIGEIMNAAAQIGDDRLQKRLHGEVRPETFTHGTSEQRQRWFRRGIISGRYQTCMEVFNSLD